MLGPPGPVKINPPVSVWCPKAGTRKRVLPPTWQNLSRATRESHLGPLPKLGMGNWHLPGTRGDPCSVGPATPGLSPRFRWASIGQCSSAVSPLYALKRARLILRTARVRISSLIHHGNVDDNSLPLQSACPRAALQGDKAPLRRKNLADGSGQCGLDQEGLILRHSQDL